MIVYLINRVKEKQVLTPTNLFSAAETQDRLSGCSILHLLPRSTNMRLVEAFTPGLDIHSMSLQFDITFIKADINNTKREV